MHAQLSTEVAKTIIKTDKTACLLIAVRSAEFKEMIRNKSDIIIIIL